MADAGFGLEVDLGEEIEGAGVAGGAHFFDGVDEGLLIFAGPDFEGLADGEGIFAAAEHVEGLADFFEPHAEPGDGAEFRGGVEFDELPPADQGLGGVAGGERVGQIPDFALALESDGVLDVPGGDFAAIGAEGELGEFVVEPAEIVADHFGEHVGGVGGDGQAMAFLGTLDDPAGQIARRLAGFDVADLGNFLIQILIGRRGFDAEDERGGWAGGIEIIFQRRAMFGDKFLGLANDDDFCAAEHREAAELIEHVGELRCRAFEIDALSIGREFFHERGEGFELEKRIASGQRDRGGRCGFSLGHAWKSFTLSSGGKKARLRSRRAGQDGRGRCSLGENR